MGFAMLVACSASPAPPPAHPAPPANTATGPAIHRFTYEDNWGNGMGCTPRGDEVTLEGTLVVRPFGKGATGAVVRTDAGEDWIVNYRAEGVLLELRDQRVVATGRPCDKQGQALAGKHFDLATLTVAR